MKSLYTTENVNLKKGSFPKTVCEKELEKILIPAIYDDLFIKPEYLRASDLFVRLLYDRKRKEV